MVSLLTKKYLLLNSLLPLCVWDTFEVQGAGRSHLRSTVGPAQFRNWKFEWILTTELLAEWCNSGSDPKLFDLENDLSRLRWLLEQGPRSPARICPYVTDLHLAATSQNIQRGGKSTRGNTSQKTLPASAPKSSLKY